MSRLWRELDGRDQGISRAELRALVEQASEDGAVKALKRLGLQDDEAGSDLSELRGLLEAWRDVKRTAWRSAVRWVVSMIISMILLGVAVKLKIISLTNGWGS